MGTFIAIAEKIGKEAEGLSAEVLEKIEAVAHEAMQKVESLIDAHKASTVLAAVPEAPIDAPAEAPATTEALAAE